MKERKHEGGERQCDAALRDASAVPRKRAGAASRSSAEPASSHELPPDLRTPSERAEDDRAESQHWDECRAEGYEAARDYAGAAATESSRPRWWAIIKKLTCRL